AASADAGACAVGAASVEAPRPCSPRPQPGAERQFLARWDRPPPWFPLAGQEQLAPAAPLVPPALPPAWQRTRWRSAWASPWASARGEEPDLPGSRFARRFEQRRLLEPAWRPQSPRGSLLEPELPALAQSVSSYRSCSTRSRPRPSRQHQGSSTRRGNRIQLAGSAESEAMLARQSLLSTQRRSLARPVCFAVPPWPELRPWQRVPARRL